MRALDANVGTCLVVGHGVNRIHEILPRPIDQGEYGAVLDLLPVGLEQGGGDFPGVSVVDDKHVSADRLDRDEGPLGIGRGQEDRGRVGYVESSHGSVF